MDDSLSFESFFEGAKESGGAALGAHGRGEYGQFALNGGSAVEKLAKAILVSKNPMYILELKGSAEMLFHLGGHRTAKRIRTIQASEAVARLRMLKILAEDLQLDLLIELRNGAAHTKSGDQAKSLLPTLTQTIAILMEYTGKRLDEFWGRRTAIAIAATDYKRSKIDRETHIKIKQAQHRFEDQHSDLPETARRQFDIERFWVQHDLSFAEQGFKAQITERCPACSSTALVTCANHGTNSQPDFIPASLYCTKCRLDLTNREELESAGIDMTELDKMATHQTETFRGVIEMGYKRGVMIDTRAMFG